MKDEIQLSKAQLRASYQQKVAAFLFDSSSANSWTRDAARSITLRAVYNTTSQEYGPDCSSKDFMCLACGTLSYPLNHSIAPNEVIIRSMKRGSTRRRRASRSKAAQLSREAVQKQRMGNTNTNPKLRKEIIEENQRIKLSNIYRLGDGRSRHCVVNKCGFCGNERKRKGVEVNGIQKADISNKRSKQNRFAKSTTADSKKQVEKQDQFKDVNFISLPGNPKKRKAADTKSAAALPKAGNSFKQNQNNISPLLSGGKKKKTKKQPAGSKLMDFLSSLND